MSDKKHKVEFWTSNDENCYPEQKIPGQKIPGQKIVNDEISVCISGGGLRSVISACGWIKGLDYIEIKPKYLSTVSGSSWFNLPYYYIDYNILGEYYPPCECTHDNVCKFLNDINSFEFIIYKSNILNDLIYYKNWNKVISKNFFEPYGLNNQYNLNDQIIKDIINQRSNIQLLTKKQNHSKFNKGSSLFEATQYLINNGISFETFLEENRISNE